MLLDFGCTHEAPLNNLLRAGVDASKPDAPALSHGHYDRFAPFAGSAACPRPDGTAAGVRHHHGMPLHFLP